MSPVGAFLIQFELTRCFVMMRDWKEDAVSVLHSEACMNFREFAERLEVGVLLFLETWNSFVYGTWNLKLVNLFSVWFSFMWTVVCEGYRCCRAFMLATVDLMTCLRVLYKPLWPVDQFMFALHVHDSWLCECDCCFIRLLCSLPWNGDSRVFLTRSHSSYPWNGAGRTGLKSGRTIVHWNQLKGSQNPSMLEISGILGNLL